MNKMSTIRKFRRNIATKLCPLYFTTIGSLITTVMQVTGKSEDDAMKHYSLIKKNAKTVIGDKTFKEIAEYIFTTFGDEAVEATWKNSLVIVYDDVRTPMFALFDGERVLPLKRDGTYTGILMQLMKEEPNIYVEKIFDEN
jgi:hypothetical protein